MLGDLTDEEIRQIQDVVDRAGRPLEVVGSAARGERKGVGTDGPITKGVKSDIDYAIPPASYAYFEGANAQDLLPGVDPNDGLLMGIHSPHDGPSIRFEPGQLPRWVPAS